MKRFLGCLILFPALALAKGEIDIRPHSLIQHGSPVRMSDIMDTRDLDPDTAQRLADVPLAAAPAPGERLEFSSTAISGLLRAALPTLAGSPHLKIPNRVVIERTSHKWERPVIESELLSYWQPLCNGCQLEIDQMTLPAGTIENWKMSPKKSFRAEGSPCRWK